MTAVPYIGGPLDGQTAEGNAMYRDAITGEPAHTKKTRKMVNRYRR